MNDTSSKLVIVGWNVGFQKVEFTKLLRCNFGFSLTEAKSITDKVLDGERAELAVDRGDRSRIANEATALGAIVAEENKEATCR